MTSRGPAPLLLSPPHLYLHMQFFLISWLPRLPPPPPPPSNSSPPLSWVKKRAGNISVIHGLDRGWVLRQVDKKILSFCCHLHALCTLSLSSDVLPSLQQIEVQLRYDCDSATLTPRRRVKWKECALRSGGGKGPRVWEAAAEFSLHES